MKSVSDPYLVKNYPIMRIALGLGSMGANLALLWGVFILSWGDNVLHPVPTLKDLLWLIPCIFSLLLLLNLPWDWLAGFYLEKKSERYEGSFRRWFFQWLAGAAGYGLLQVAGGYLIALWIFGYGFALIIILLLPAIFAASRIWQFYLIPPSLKKNASWPEGYEEKLKAELKKLKEPWPEDLYLYRSEDGSTLNGGRVGMGSHSRLMISDSSAQFLSPRELAILIMREERYLGWAAGQKHFHFGLGWGLAGILVCLPGIPLLGLSGMTAWLWLLAAMTTWHGLSLVFLPGIARRQILRADREVVEEEISRSEYVALLKKIQSYNWTPAFGMGVVEYLFLPIPSLETRVSRLDRL